MQLYILVPACRQAGEHRRGGENTKIYMLTMYKQITIQTLHKQGVQKTQIARELGCHRNTVNNVLQRGKLIEKQTRSKPSCFDPYKTQIKEWIDKKISRLRIHELLRETYRLTRAYDSLCKYIQKQFPKQREAFGVQQTLPGEMAEIDFGYLGMLPNFEGKLVKTYGLAVVLAYSRLDYFAICYDQKLETLIKELTNAFEYFRGVTRKLKVDNMKTAILKNQHYDLTFNQDFLEFANHYGTVVVPCTPYHPEQKGMVESGVKYLQNNFIAGRTFQDAADLRRQLKDWMENYANKRVHGTTRKVPLEVFLNEEKEKLQPLPQEEFSFFNRGIRRVNLNCHIHFENNYYSVPFSLVDKEVTIRWNEHLIRIIYQDQTVALHHKSKGTGNYVTQRHHLPTFKVYSETEYQTRFEEKMIEIGGSAHAYFRMLLGLKDGYWFRTVRAILGLSTEYGNEAVNLSLKRAMYYKVTDLTTIKNILEKRLYLLETEPKLLNIKTQEETSMYRDLTYYKDRL